MREKSGWSWIHGSKEDENQELGSFKGFVRNNYQKGISLEKYRQLPTLHVVHRIQLFYRRLLVLSPLDEI